MPFASFDDLPNHIKVWLRSTGQPDPEQWVQKPIPALGDRSILQVADEPDADQRLADFCGRVVGKFS